MGAEFVTEYYAGSDVKSVYRDAVDEALYESGHGGYSGTIAESSGVVLADESFTDKKVAYEYAGSLWDDRRIEKWGPALAFAVKDETGKTIGFVFAGWYSS